MNKRQIRNVRKRNSYEFWYLIISGHFALGVISENREMAKVLSLRSVLRIWTHMDSSRQFHSHKNAVWHHESLLLAFSDIMGDLTNDEELSHNLQPYVDSVQRTMI